jgi:subtilase family serine protease
MMKRAYLAAVLAVVFALHCALATKSAAFTTIEGPAATLCAFKGECARGDWALLGRSTADALHSVTIAVKLRANAEAACDALLMEISTPGSRRAGLHYTHEQVGQLLSDFANTRIVEQWLRAYSIEHRTTANGDFIHVTASVAQLEQLLHARFHDFSSKTLDFTVRRTSSISLPENVHSPPPSL